MRRTLQIRTYLTFRAPSYPVESRSPTAAYSTSTNALAPERGFPLAPTCGVGTIGFEPTAPLTPSSHEGQRHAQARLPWSPSSLLTRVKESTSRSPGVHIGLFGSQLEYRPSRRTRDAGETRFSSTPHVVAEPAALVCAKLWAAAEIMPQAPPDRRAADQADGPADAVPPPDAVGQAARHPWRHRRGRVGPASAGSGAAAATPATRSWLGLSWLLTASRRTKPDVTVTQTGLRVPHVHDGPVGVVARSRRSVSRCASSTNASCSGPLNRSA